VSLVVGRIEGFSKKIQSENITKNKVKQKENMRKESRKYFS
jgi:hypothetical protein